ncbi:MAG: methyltransferase [Alphaproteobacteria bacterium]|nr:methyltransferase [Alphaproteobacteria bacterium]
MTPATDPDAGLATVSASLNYLAGGAAKPFFYPSVAGAAETTYATNAEAHDVVVHDARPIADRFTLDVHGFQLVRHDTKVRDFLDPDEVKCVYEPEVIALVRRHVGSEAAVIFDHTLRASTADLREAQRMRDPAKTVHNDYTDRSAPRRLRDFLPEAEAERRLARRFAVVQVWRSIAGPVESSPMALCDPHSVDPADLVPAERRANDRVGEIHQVLWSPRHRWYYFSRLRRDEAILIKTFDSATDGRARFAIHTAFDLPGQDAAPPRESIETRTFAFF